MDKEQGDIAIGMLIGALLMFIVWMVANEITEQVKTNDGYLTYKNIRYTVTEYDRLDIPPKPEKKTD